MDQLLTLALVMIFLRVDPKNKGNEGKNNKWDYIKLKRLCLLVPQQAKETINKMKRQPTEREKIFASNTSEKGLVSKIYKELI